jgi:DNA-binding NarL/FixJ family response regulator
VVVRKTIILSNEERELRHCTVEALEPRAYPLPTIDNVTVAATLRSLEGYFSVSKHPSSGLPRHAVGLLALAPSGKILYMNAEAHHFCAQLARANGSCPSQGLPGAIESAVACLSRTGSISGEPVRVPVGDHDALMIRAFLVSGTVSRKSPLIIVLVEHWSESGGDVSGLLETDLQLTGREREVLGCLIKGFTNKEIAVALGISEATVKAHLRGIMVKTQTTTRMGLVACVLGPRSEPSP